ncbi:MAG: hypothetical protein GX298_01770 [Planctomycetes bacterium]|nr:hypothetical protein [Planctomycetota bacterium]
MVFGSVDSLFIQCVRRGFLDFDFAAVRQPNSSLCFSTAHIPEGLQRHTALVFSGMSPPMVTAGFLQ